MQLKRCANNKFQTETQSRQHEIFTVSDFVYTCTVNWFSVLLYCKLVLCSRSVRNVQGQTFQTNLNQFRENKRNVQGTDITNERNVKEQTLQV